MTEEEGGEIKMPKDIKRYSVSISVVISAYDRTRKGSGTTELKFIGEIVIDDLLRLQGLLEEFTDKLNDIDERFEEPKVSGAD